MNVAILSAIFSFWYKCCKSVDLTMLCQVSITFPNTRKGTVMVSYLACTDRNQNSIKTNAQTAIKTTPEMKLHSLNIIKLSLGPLRDL